MDRDLHRDLDRHPLGDRVVTRHPCHGRSNRSREVFEHIAIGNDGGHHPVTLNALVAAKSINRYWQKHGRLNIKRYCVPLNVHMQWCEWCDENVTDDEIENTIRQRQDGCGS